MVKQLILIAVKGQITRQIFGPAIPSVVAAYKKKVKGNYRGWELQLRTINGYKNKKIL